MFSMHKRTIRRLKEFIEVCQTNPDLLHLKQYEFFKDFLESMGGTLPPPSEAFLDAYKYLRAADEAITARDSDEELRPQPLVMHHQPVPDILGDDQKMGDCYKEVSHNDVARAEQKRIESMNLCNIRESIDLITEAIELNPRAATLYTKRGQYYLAHGKPNACIKDCSRALLLNGDSAAAYKYRGRAYRLLEEWEKALKDLRLACALDYDNEVAAWVGEVAPQVELIERHRAVEEEKRIKRERSQKLRNPFNRVRSEHGGLDDFLRDPILREAFKDSDVALALIDISSNGMNLFKYLAMPKLVKLMGKIGDSLSSGGAEFQFYAKPDYLDNSKTTQVPDED